MPKVSDSYRPKRKAGPPATHPWKDWLGDKSGHKYRLRQGKEFTCKVHSMIVQLRMKARELGIKLSVFQEDAGKGKTDLILENRGPRPTKKGAKRKESGNGKARS